MLSAHMFFLCMSMCHLGKRVAPVKAASSSSGSSVGLVVGIVIAVLIILLILIDVSCYFINGCGALATVCSHVCGRGPMLKEKTMQEGDR